MLWFIIYIASLITSLVSAAHAEEGAASQATTQRSLDLADLQGRRFLDAVWTRRGGARR